MGTNRSGARWTVIRAGELRLSEPRASPRDAEFMPLQHPRQFRPRFENLAGKRRERRSKRCHRNVGVLAQCH